MHRRQQDYAFFTRLQPSVMKIMDGGPNDYAWVRDNLPNSLVVARDWALSEQHTDMLKDPVTTGTRHAQEWDKHANRLGFDRTKTFVLGINEPHVWEPGVPEALRAYTIALCEEASELGLRVGAMQLSVGWPANTGPDTPPNWEPWRGVDNAIRANNGALVLHEYFADAGPGEMWGWWAGRSLKCPWQVPIIIGECGIDMYVKDGSVAHASRGWQGRKEPAQYALELADYVGRMSADKRFVGCCVFAADFASHEWFSFDIERAYDAIVATPIPQPTTPPVDTHIPWVGNGPTPVEPEAHIPEQPDNTWQRSWPIVLKFEGGLSLDPNDTGNWYNGQLIGTKYGISAAVWAGQYDIPNLTQAQALSIYKTAYWDAANCDALPWPLCLAVFDHAINAGVGSARQLLSQSGPNFLVFMADRIAWYTRLAQFDIYGVAWMRRCAEVLREGAK